MLHTVLCLLAREEVEPSEVVVLATLREAAEEAVERASGCPCPWSGEPPLRGREVRVVLLPYSDVDSGERVRDLRRRVARLLTLDTVLDVTGGRKAMAVAAAVEAASRGVPVVAAQLRRWSTYFEATGAETLCGKSRPEEAVLIRF